MGLGVLSHIYTSPGNPKAALWTVVVAGLSRPDKKVLGCLLERAHWYQSALNLTSWFDVKSIVTKDLWLESACDAGEEKFWRQVSRSGEDSEVHDYKQYSLTKSMRTGECSYPAMKKRCGIKWTISFG